METLKTPENLIKKCNRLCQLYIDLALNCKCGELKEECAFPYCDSGGETLPEIKSKLCEDCPTPEDCERYTCQWGD